MNLRELAKALKLAPSTVSICLTGDPVKAKISPRTVERVRAYADSVGYVPNRFAQKIFQRGDCGTIGLLVKQDNALDRNMPILQSAMERLGAANREYVVQCCPEDQIVETLRLFKGMKIDHVILIGAIGGARHLSGAEALADMELYALDYCFEMADAADGVLRCRMGIDRAELYRTLARTLERHGFGPFLCDQNCRVNALMEDGLLTSDRILEFPCRLGSYFEVGSALAELVVAKKPRTVLLHSDQTAIGLCDALIRHGVRIPEEIAVLGFNSSAFSGYAAIPLTTVELPILHNLKLVLDHLLDGADLPEELRLSPKIVCRNSTPTELNQILNALNKGEKE